MFSLIQIIIGLFILKILLCKNEEEENDYEDVDGPIYYENEEQLKEYNILRSKNGEEKEIDYENFNDSVFDNNQEQHAEFNPLKSNIGQNRSHITPIEI